MSAPVVSVLSNNVNIQVFLQSARPFPTPSYLGGGTASYSLGLVQAPLSCPRQP